MSDRLSVALRDANSLFGSLVNSAFSEELTAAWEAANAQLIATQADLHQRLPRLAVLATIREVSRRRELERAEASVMITALMKYIFLIQMERTSRHRLYRFVPYHYGPFT